MGYIEAGVEEVGWFPKGHRVGAEHGLATRRPTKIAVLSVGYYHGFGVDRHKSERSLFEALKRRNSKLFVKVNGQRARVLGNVGMLHTIIDVTNVECSVGDSVILDVDPG